MAIALFLLSFIVRAAFLVAVTDPNRPLDGDEPEYHAYAASFARGDGWRNGVELSGRPPVISFQLLLTYLVTGPDTAAGRWTMVFYSSLVAPALYLVGRSLLAPGHGGHAVAALAALAWALYPPAIWYAGFLYTENTAALLIVVTVGGFIWAARNGSLRAAALAGALWGVTALNRPVYLLIPVGLLLAWWAVSRTGAAEWRWRRGAWAAGIAGMVVVMAPWTIRNYVEHRVFMPTTSQGGRLLLMTNGLLDDESVRRGGYQRDPELMAAWAAGATEAERDRIGRELAFEELKRNWTELPVPVFNRARNFWTWRPDPFDPHTTRNDLVMAVVWIPALLLFAAGPMPRSPRRYWPALALIAVAFVTTLVFWGTPRFRFPVDPLIILGAAAGFAGAVAWLRPARARRVLPPGDAAGRTSGGPR